MQDQSLDPAPDQRAQHQSSDPAQTARVALQMAPTTDPLEPLSLSLEPLSLHGHAPPEAGPTPAVGSGGAEGGGGGVRASQPVVPAPAAPAKGEGALFTGVTAMVDSGTEVGQGGAGGGAHPAPRGGAHNLEGAAPAKGEGAQGGGAYPGGTADDALPVRSDIRKVAAPAKGEGALFTGVTAMVDSGSVDAFLEATLNPKP